MQAKASPQNDFPRMPRSCVDPKDLIPQEPGMCKLNTYRQARPTVVLWGDSHAWQMIPALKGAIKGRNVNLVAFVMGGCPPMDPHLNTPKKRKNATSCQKSNDLALRYALKRKLRRADRAGPRDRHPAAVPPARAGQDLDGRGRAVAGGPRGRRVPAGA